MIMFLERFPQSLSIQRGIRHALYVSTLLPPGHSKQFAVIINSSVYVYVFDEFQEFNSIFSRLIILLTRIN